MATPCAPVAVPVRGTAKPEGLGDLIASHQPGYNLPQPFYTAADIFAWDLARVWRRQWLYAGMAAAIPKPGDWFTYAVAGDEALILRGDDGVVRAFANVCPHRGSRLCRGDHGHARQIVCPYHAWVFDRQGDLRAARMMGDGFDRSAHGLRGLPCEVLADGFIFIGLQAEMPDFAPFRAAFAPDLAAYGLADLRLAHARTVTCHANWKLLVENFRECYHCAPTHPEYIRTVVGASLSDRKESIDQAWTSLEAAAQAQGLTCGYLEEETPDGMFFHRGRYPYQAGYRSMSRDGARPAPRLGTLGDEDVGIFSFVTYPNGWMDAAADHVMTMRVTPQAADRCELRFEWWVRGDAEPGRDFHAEDVAWFWTVTGDQDVRLCEDTHAGVSTASFRPGPLGPQESGTRQFIEWYLRRIQSD